MNSSTTTHAFHPPRVQTDRPLESSRLDLSPGLHLDLKSSESTFELRGQAESLRASPAPLPINFIDQPTDSDWSELETAVHRSQAVTVEDLSSAKRFALGLDTLIHTQPDQASTKIADLQGKLRSIPDTKERSLDRVGPIRIALDAMLTHQKKHADSLVKIDPFNKALLTHGRAALWDAAANMLPRGNPGRSLFKGRAQYLSGLKNDSARGAEGSPLADPENVARPGSKSKTVEVAVDGGASRIKIPLADLTFQRKGSTLRRDHEGLQQSVEAAVRKQPVSERALTQATLASILKRMPDDPLQGKKIKDRFRITLNEWIKRQPNPAIERVVPIPIHSADRKGAPSLSQVTCRQDPAQALTRSLSRAFEADRITGVNCHDDQQHQHAVNLYRSSLEDAQGRSLLTMVRHGVHSASALTGKGIQALTDEELGKIALDLSPDVDDAPLKTLCEASRTKSPAAASAFLSDRKQAAPDERVGASDYDLESLKTAGAYVRRSTGWAEAVHYVKTQGGLSLLDRLAQAANQRRALESVQAAITCLPPQELQDMAAQASTGEIPNLRLASVSLLTPDAFRGLKGGPTKDERLMWRHQQAAWQALTARDHLELDIPVTESNGEGVLGIKTEDGQPVTKRTRVKLEVAAFNIPVNEGGAHARAGGWSLVVGNSPAANRQAIEQLLGKLPNLVALNSWTPAGWVGQALARVMVEPTAEDFYTLQTPKDRTQSPKDRMLLLAKQVAQICIEPDSGPLRQADPYRLVKRLLVLVHQTGLAVPLVNCRSGKDRTSEAETQARQFALEASTRGGGDLPPVDQPAGVDDEVQKAQMWALHAGGGSPEIQRWNTLHAGTKLGDAALTAQYGDMDKFQGTSKHIQS